MVTFGLKSIIGFGFIVLGCWSHPYRLDDMDDGIEEPDPNLNVSDILSLMAHGVEVSLLIDTNSINSINSEPIDYDHVQTACKEPETPSLRNGMTNPNRRWYDTGRGTYFVPCVVNPSYTQRERDLLFAAMVEIQDTTCIRFYLYNNGRELEGHDYVEIINSDSGCYSEGLGRLRKGRQVMNLMKTNSQGYTCMIKGIAVHELIHVIGFHHEQNTPNRDDWVTIMWDNIENSPGARYQFEKLSSREASNYGAPYDYGSIMHYARRDFSSNGRDTIVAKSNGVSFGQRDKMSRWDGWKINKMYGCPTE